MEQSENIHEGLKNPLLNYHIVEKILKHCKKLPTLLNCRLVCHIWNNEVLRILQRSQVTAVIKGPERIDEFLTCIETSDEDPLPYSSFAVELLAEDPENKIFHLLEKLRYSAKHLKLEYDPLLSQGYSSEEQEGGTEEVSPTAKGEPEISETSLPLSVSLHKLESLHLFSTNIFPPDSTDGLHRMPPLFENLQTPRLTSLSVQHMYDTDCSNTAIKLINSSKTMLFCLKFPCNEFPKIVHHVSLSHLAELDICDLFHGSFSTNNTIQCIINSCPKLQKLSLELGFRVTPECVYKLFQALCGSLMYLKLIIQDRNLLSRNVQRVNFRFPRMPEMRQLFLRFTNPGLVYYIDEMPKLTSLEMETPWTRRVRGNIFPGVVAMYNSLRTLNLSEKLTADDIQTICKFFPNLNALCASFVSNDAIMEVFRSLIKLESLIIDRNSSINDCALCGVSENDLKHLEGKFLERNKYESRDFLDGQSTVGPCSIQNLTKLKELKLVQAGLTWRSIVFAVTSVSWLHLRSLAVQTTTLKTGDYTSLIEDYIIVKLLKNNLSLKRFTVWTRRNVERLQSDEMEFLQELCPEWDINVALQTSCSFSS